VRSCENLVKETADVVQVIILMAFCIFFNAFWSLTNGVTLKACYNNCIYCNRFLLLEYEPEARWPYRGM